MGCLGAKVVDPETTKILNDLNKKVDEFQETFDKEAEEVKKKQQKQLDERHKKLTELKEKKEEITEETLKKLNEEELKVEIDILTNAADKMHCVFNAGLELVKPLKKKTLDELSEKAKKAPAITLDKINKQIEEVKNYPDVEFFNSTYGKVLKEACEKQGMSESLLTDTKKQIFKERQERRKKEREEFDIKVNEFEGENIDKIKLDLFSLVTEELEKGKVFKDYFKEKMTENMKEK